MNKNLLITIQLIAWMIFIGWLAVTFSPWWLILIFLTKITYHNDKDKSEQQSQQGIIENWEERIRDNADKYMYLLSEIKDLLGEQAQKTRKETLEEVIQEIEIYKDWAKIFHKDAHKDNQNMLMYDAHSRIVACDHLLEKLKSLINNQ